MMCRNKLPGSGAIMIKGSCKSGILAQLDGKKLISSTTKAACPVLRNFSTDTAYGWFDGNAISPVMKLNAGTRRKHLRDYSCKRC